MKTPSNQRDGKKDIFLILLPTVLGICLCVACLVGGTFAWFTATSSAPTQPILAANYTVAVTVFSDGEAVPFSDGGYALVSGREYTVTLTATGDASTGYCVISLTGETGEPALYHTANFPTKAAPSETVLRFRLTPGEDGKMTVTPQWGSSAKNDSEKWKNGGAYPLAPESPAP